VGADDVAGALIAGHGQDLGEEDAAEQNRVADDPVDAVRRQRERLLRHGGAEGGGEYGDDVLANLRLVAEEDQGAGPLRADGRQPGAERGALADGEGGIEDDAEAIQAGTEGVADGVGFVAEDEDDLVEAGGEGAIDDVGDDGLAAQVEELLGPAEAGGAAGGEDDGGDYSCTPRMLPVASVSGPPGRPWRMATISPRIEIAISSGVSAPMFSPIGPRTRARLSSVTPASSRRRRRSRLVERLPTAPM
jgi:hypothetical protein